MKSFLYAAAVGVAFSILEVIMLNVVTADLQHELSTKVTYTVVDRENTIQGLSVAHRTSHSLGADYLQASGEDGDALQPTAHSASQVQ